MNLLRNWPPVPSCCSSVNDQVKAKSGLRERVSLPRGVALIICSVEGQPLSDLPGLSGGSEGRSEETDKRGERPFRGRGH